MSNAERPFLGNGRANRSGNGVMSDGIWRVRASKKRWFPVRGIQRGGEKQSKGVKSAMFKKGSDHTGCAQRGFFAHKDVKTSKIPLSYRERWGESSKK